MSQKPKTPVEAQVKAQRREGDEVQRILDGLPKNPTRRRMLLPPLAG